MRSSESLMDALSGACGGRLVEKSGNLVLCSFDVERLLQSARLVNALFQVVQSNHHV
jgi:hypothetical protein